MVSIDQFLSELYSMHCLFRQWLYPYTFFFFVSTLTAMNEYAESYLKAQGTLGFISEAEQGVKTEMNRNRNERGTVHRLSLGLGLEQLLDYNFFCRHTDFFCSYFKIHVCIPCSHMNSIFTCVEIGCTCIPFLSSAFLLSYFPCKDHCQDLQPVRIGYRHWPVK